MHLSFHIKTVWTSSSSKTLIVSANKSLANLESIRKTLAVSPILERRAKKVAWVQIRIEIPTCKELNECEYPARSLEYTVFKTDTQ